MAFTGGQILVKKDSWRKLFDFCESNIKWLANIIDHRCICLNNDTFIDELKLKSTLSFDGIEYKDWTSLRNANIVGM